MNEKCLEIAKGRQTFVSSYFEDQDQFTQLCLYCRDHFGHDMRIKILENSEVPPHLENSETHDQTHALDSHEEGYSEPVRDVLQIFQGEVKEERIAKGLKNNQENG